MAFQNGSLWMDSPLAGMLDELDEIPPLCRP
jgi:hypothetical protein